MRSLFDLILKGDLHFAKEEFQSKMQELVSIKLNEYRKQIIADEFGDCELELEEIDELDEANIQKMGRTKLIRVRIRKGKVQRRKKFSAIKGYTIRGGKMVRMSSQERRHRKMGARRARIKRRSKLRQALRKRKMSLRKRKAMGL